MIGQVSESLAMQQGVSLEMTELCEHTLTDVTPVLAVPGVQPLVAPQAAQLCEALLTRITRVRLFSGVHCLVLS